MGLYLQPTWGLDGGPGEAREAISWGPGEAREATSWGPGEAREATSWGPLETTEAAKQHGNYISILLQDLTYFNSTTNIKVKVMS